MQSKKDINYLSKDFNQFRENLINFAKTYYKNTYNDFSEGDPGMMFIEMSSYVGDVLTYYNDYALTQALLNHTSDPDIIIDTAQSYGYKPKPSYPARTKVDLYQLLPANINSGTTTPNWDYSLVINSGLEISPANDTSNTFRSLDSINFAASSSNNPTDITIYQVNPNTGLVDYYLLKKTIDVEAGLQKTKNVTIGAGVPYYTIDLPDTNIISIDEVSDSQGNIWYEVPYLAQDSIFIEIPNTNTVSTGLAQYKNEVPYLLKIKKTPRRFITRYLSDNTLQLRFGSGLNNYQDEVLTPNMDNIGLPLPSGRNNINSTWNPANFIYTKAYGQVPSNTTLIIKYTVGGGIQSNIPANTLQNISKVSYSMSDTSLNTNVLTFIKKSLRCSNSLRATGGRGQETVDEIRDNTLAFFMAQDRIVNNQDFITRVYSMPAKFGNIAKAYLIQDEQLNLYDYLNRTKNPFGLNLYILTYNNQKQLIQANDAIKTNLKTYLSKFKILTDSINIKDAFIINIAISFEITVLQEYVANDVLLNCIAAVKEYFKIDNWQINQPIFKFDVSQIIANVKGVQSVMSLRFYNKFDSNLGYSANIYDLDTATRDNILYPSLDPSIFEVRFPNSDVYGRCVSY